MSGWTSTAALPTHAHGVVKSLVASWLGPIFTILPVIIETVLQADPEPVREPVGILNLARPTLSVA